MFSGLTHSEGQKTGRVNIAYLIRYGTLCSHVYMLGLVGKDTEWRDCSRGWRLPCGEETESSDFKSER